MGSYRNHCQLLSTVLLSIFQQSMGNLRSFLCCLDSSIRLGMVSFYTILLDNNNLCHRLHNHSHLSDQLMNSKFLLHKDSFLYEVFQVFCQSLIPSRMWIQVHNQEVQFLHYSLYHLYQAYRLCHLDMASNSQQHCYLHNLHWCNRLSRSEKQLTLRHLRHIIPKHKVFVAWIMFLRKSRSRCRESLHSRTLDQKYHILDRPQKQNR